MPSGARCDRKDAAHASLGKSHWVARSCPAGKVGSPSASSIAASPPTDGPTAGPTGSPATPWAVPGCPTACPVKATPAPSPHAAANPLKGTAPGPSGAGPAMDTRKKRRQRKKRRHRKKRKTLILSKRPYRLRRAKIYFFKPRSLQREAALQSLKEHRTHSSQPCREGPLGTEHAKVAVDLEASARLDASAPTGPVAGSRSTPDSSTVPIADGPTFATGLPTSCGPGSPSPMPVKSSGCPIPVKSGGAEVSNAATAVGTTAATGSQADGPVTQELGLALEAPTGQVVEEPIVAASAQAHRSLVGVHAALADGPVTGELGLVLEVPTVALDCEEIPDQESDCPQPNLMLQCNCHSDENVFHLDGSKSEEESVHQIQAFSECSDEDSKPPSLEQNDSSCSGFWLPRVLPRNKCDSSTSSDEPSDSEEETECEAGETGHVPAFVFVSPSNKHVSSAICSETIEPRTDPKRDTKPAAFLESAVAAAAVVATTWGTAAPPTTWSATPNGPSSPAPAVAAAVVPFWPVKAGADSPAGLATGPAPRPAAAGAAADAAFELAASASTSSPAAASASCSPFTFLNIIFQGKTYPIQDLHLGSKVEDAYRSVSKKTGYWGHFQLWQCSSDARPRHLDSTAKTLGECGLQEGDNLQMAFTMLGAGKQQWTGGKQLHMLVDDMQDNESSSEDDGDDEDYADEDPASFGPPLAGDESDPYFSTSEPPASSINSEDHSHSASHGANEEETVAEGTMAEAQVPWLDGDSVDLEPDDNDSDSDDEVCQVEEETSTEQHAEETTADQWQCHDLIKSLASSKIDEKVKQKIWDSLNFETQFQTSLSNALLQFAVESSDEARKFIAYTFAPDCELVSLRLHHLSLEDVPCAMASILAAFAKVSWQHMATHSAWNQLILPRLAGGIDKEKEAMDDNDVRKSLYAVAAKTALLFLPPLDPLEGDLGSRKSSGEKFSLFDYSVSKRVVMVQESPKHIAPRSIALLPFEGLKTTMPLFGCEATLGRRVGFPEKGVMPQKHVMGVLSELQKHLRDKFKSCQQRRCIATLTRTNVLQAEKRYIANQMGTSVGKLTDEDRLNWLEQHAAGKSFCASCAAQPATHSQCLICAKKTSKQKKRPDVFRGILNHHCKIDPRDVYLNQGSFSFISEGSDNPSHALLASLDERLVAASIACPRCVKEFNNKGLPLDKFFESGRVLRQVLKLDDGETVEGREAQQQEPSKIIVHPIAPDQTLWAFHNHKGATRPILVAPMVMSVSNMLSEDVKSRLLEALNRTPFCEEPSGKGKDANLRACYANCRDKLNSNTCELELGADVADGLGGPLVELGPKALQAVLCEAVEKAVLDLQTELANFFIDKTNEVMLEFVHLDGTLDGQRALEAHRGQQQEQLGGSLVVTERAVPTVCPAFPEGHPAEDDLSDSSATDSSAPQINKKRRSSARVSGQPRKKPDNSSCSSATESADQDQAIMELRNNFHNKGVCFLARQHNNMAIIKSAIGGGFTDHQDWQAIITSLKGQQKIPAPRGGWFPTQPELMVVTFVLSAASHDLAKRTVVWKKGKGGVVHASIDTYDNCGHVQGIYANWKDVHHATETGKVDAAALAASQFQIIHNVVTARTAIIPRDNPSQHWEQIHLDGLAPADLQTRSRSMLRYKYDIVKAATRPANDNAEEILPTAREASFQQCQRAYMKWLVRSLVENEPEAWRIFLSPPSLTESLPDPEAAAQEEWESLRRRNLENDGQEILQNAQQHPLFTKKLEQLRLIQTDSLWWKADRFLQQQIPEPEPESEPESDPEPGPDPGPAPVPPPVPESLFDAPVLLPVGQVELKPRCPFSKLPAFVDDWYHNEHLPPELREELFQWLCANEDVEVTDAARERLLVKGLSKAQQTMGIKRASRAVTSQHHTMVKQAIMHDCIIEATDEKERKGEPAVFLVRDRIPPPGLGLREAEAPGKYNQNQCQIVDIADPTGATVIRNYKNPGLFEELARVLEKMCQDYVEDFCTRTDQPAAGRVFFSLAKEEEHRMAFEAISLEMKRKPLWLHGPGGSTLIPGTNPPSPSTRFDDCHQGTGSKQSMDDKIIRSLVKTYEQDSLVTLCIHRAKFCETKGKCNVEEDIDYAHPVTVLGGFRIKGYEANERAFKDIWEHYQSMKYKYLKDYLPLISFQMFGAVRFQLEMVYEWKHVQKLLQNWKVPGNPYEKLNVSKSDHRPLAGPAGQIMKWVGENKVAGSGTSSWPEEEESTSSDSSTTSHSGTKTSSQESKTLTAETDHISVAAVLEMVKRIQSQDGTVSRTKLLQELGGDMEQPVLVSPSKSFIQSPVPPNDIFVTCPLGAAAGETDFDSPFLMQADLPSSPVGTDKDAEDGSCEDNVRHSAMGDDSESKANPADSSSEPKDDSLEHDEEVHYIRKLLNKVKLDRIHPTWVKKDWIVDYLVSETGGDKQKFKALLEEETHPDPNNGPFRLTPKQVLTALALNSGIAAVRADPLMATIPAAKLSGLTQLSGVTLEGKQKKILAKAAKSNSVYAVTPVASCLHEDDPSVLVADVFNSAFAEGLKPIGNRDLDLVTTFMHHSISCLIQETDAVRKKIVDPISSDSDRGGLDRYELQGKAPWNGAYSDQAVELLGASLFMILVCRVTGNTAILNRYASWRKIREDISTSSANEVRSLPIDTKWSVEDFCCFLDSEFSDPGHFSKIISRQHKESIPDGIIDDLDTFKSFLRHFSTAFSPRAIFCGASSDPERQRLEMILAVAKALERSSKKMQSSEGAMFLAHLAISDLDGMFPGVAGGVTLASIFLGFGSTNGLKYLRGYDKMEGKQDDKIHTDPSRVKLDRFFREVEALMLTEEDDSACGQWAKLIRKALGYEIRISSIIREDGTEGTKKTLVNQVSGRVFSYIDAEHFLCKLCLFVVMVSCSRTVSEHKKTEAGHCYPAEFDFNLTDLTIQQALESPEELKKTVPMFATVNQGLFEATRHAMLQLHKSNFLNPQHMGGACMSDQLRRYSEHYVGTDQASLEKLGECDWEIDENEAAVLE